MNLQNELTIGVSTLVDLEGLFTSKGRVVLDGSGGELRGGTGKAYGDNGEALPLRRGTACGLGDIPRPTRQSRRRTFFILRRTKRKRIIARWM